MVAAITRLQVSNLIAGWRVGKLDRRTDELFGGWNTRLSFLSALFVVCRSRGMLRHFFRPGDLMVTAVRARRAPCRRESEMPRTPKLRKQPIDVGHCPR